MKRYSALGFLISLIVHAALGILAIRLVTTEAPQPPMIEMPLNLAYFVAQPEPEPEPVPEPEPEPEPESKSEPKPTPKKIIKSATTTSKTTKKRTHKKPKKVQRRTSARPKKRIHRKKTITRPAPSPSRNTNTANLMQYYKSALRQAILQNKRYPALAKRRGIEGRTVVGFTVHHTGVISNIRVIASSDEASLDRASVSAIQQVGRFRAFPPGVTSRAINLSVTIRYQLQ
jgi:periplasmic protein TonB